MRWIATMLAAAGLGAAGLAVGQAGSGAARAAEGADAGGKSQVTIAGLSVARPREGDKFGRSMAFGMNAGTHVSVVIHMGGRNILDVDNDASKLRKFADDKGTVLVKPGTDADEWLGSFAHVADDGRSCAPTLTADKLPAAGAGRLHIDATLAVVCAENPKKVSTEMKLEKGQKVKLGPVEAEVKDIRERKFGDLKHQVTLSGTQSFAAIRKLAFLDADGKEIESKSAGGSRMTFGNRTSYSRSYALASLPDEVTFKIEYWQKIETVPVVVKADVGLGLGG
jgi:hypothetical protein